MGVSSSLYVALTGLNLSQAALEVVSNNIANVNTPGYSRQRINLENLATWRHGRWGAMGTGVSAQNITRYHDQFLTRSLITKNFELGSAAARKDGLDTLEVYFNESDGNGINAALNSFFASWESLADAAELDPTRAELVHLVDTLAKQVAQRRSDLDGLRQDLNGRVAEAADNINLIIGAIAKLNHQIMVLEDPARRQEANSLRDSRDALMFQLGEIIDYDFWEDPLTGAVNITFKDGPCLVADTSVYEVGVSRDSSGDLRIIANNRRTSPPWPEDVTRKINGGALGGWLEFRDKTLKDLYIKFESFVDNLIFQVNHQHAQGVGLDLYTDTIANNPISNVPAFTFEFPGRDNDLKLSALVPHLDSREPYLAQADPENISVRFVKGESHTNKITSTVFWNDDPKVQKWEVTIVLPTDGRGNITATAEDVVRHINENRTTTLGSATLPPRSTSSVIQIGDLLAAQAAPDNNWDGRIQFPAGADSVPPGPAQFQRLNRTLAEMAAQGRHLSYGEEYASLTTTLKHTDNNVVFTALDPGAAGEKISIEYALPRDPIHTGEVLTNSPLSVDVYTDFDGSSRIVVRLATDQNGNVTTTAADIVDLINRDSETRNLVLAQTPGDQYGRGLVEPMNETYLDRSGYFELVTYQPDGEGGLIPQVYRVTVDPTDTLKDVVDRIGTDLVSGIPGLRAEIISDHDGHQNIRLIADDGIQFGFGRDTSGALAVLGLNNLFAGTSSSTIAVNQEVLRNPRLLGAGAVDPDGFRAPGSNENALAMPA
ncbi:MAG: flagellar hook-associated protein FlgK [Candidatus Adiutrix sp.]|nr:flagellar hook-associated protein FlgK [Candidatus Adiutrix sp.]